VPAANELGHLGEDMDEGNVEEGAGAEQHCETRAVDAGERAAWTLKA
jgi:hypothetical protein